MVHKKTTEELVAERLATEAKDETPRVPIVVIVDNVRSLDNVGMIFRLCELARVEKLYLTGYTGHPRKASEDRPEMIVARHEHRITKTAVYALPYQPWAFELDPVPIVEEYKDKKWQIVALEQTDTSDPYHQAEYRLPTVLIVGHEREGVRQELLDLADRCVEIPILGQGNSHNVATATGILLYKVLEKTGKI